MKSLRPKLTNFPRSLIRRDKERNKLSDMIYESFRILNLRLIKGLLSLSFVFILLLIVVNDSVNADLKLDKWEL